MRKKLIIDSKSNDSETGEARRKEVFGILFSRQEILARLHESNLSYYRSNWANKKVDLILNKVRELDWRGDEYLSELGWEVNPDYSYCF